MQRLGKCVLGIMSPSVAKARSRELGLTKATEAAFDAKQYRACHPRVLEQALQDRHSGQQGVPH
ncbi:hypothetical protein HaLaN_29356 [Haematococcus lacustris]|uniref:Uncharacterized protein n=1 Tax=Haematococcus lacustris TaxID=44745 RepID=A0A6A0ACE2_HAELA|nr:hypothetical protein HaLaN_29356 [Haematococcus lacustris]